MRHKIHALFLLSNLATFSLEVTFSIFQVLHTEQYTGVPKMYTHFKRCYLCITFRSWIELR